MNDRSRDMPDSPNSEGALVAQSARLRGAIIGSGGAAVAAALNNLGMGIAGVSGDFRSISETAKGIMCIGMLLGRLEIFTLLVLFTPAFWRK